VRASYRFLLLAFLAPAYASAQADTPERQREVFRTAWAQASAMRPEAADTAALRGHVLYPYLQASRLRWGLSRIAAKSRDAALETRIQTFLKTHSGLPVTQELQRDWLRYLGEREAWSEFLQQAPDSLSDPVLQCYGFAARLSVKDLDGLREAILALWLTHRELLPACEPAFRWLDTPERLSDAEIAQRARFAADERLPLPAAARFLPPESYAAALFRHRLLAQPERGLKRFVAGEDPGSGPGQALLAGEQLLLPPADDAGDALVQAFERLARQNSPVARTLFEPLLQQRALNELQRAQLQRAYALGLAYDHDPEAVRHFNLPPVALDTLAHEWRVRAALLHGDWNRALQWLLAMPDAQRQEPRWRYWRARALEQRGERRAAKSLYEDVAKEREYYGFLAAERLGRIPDLRPQALPEDQAALEFLSGFASMQRARELFLCDLPELAAAEFRHAQRDLPAAQRSQAARLAASWGWHEQAVLLLAELLQWDDLWLRFPLPFNADVEAAARDSGLAADWLYAVLRTESLYNPRALSSAGALGLMQLRLPTARAVAQRAKLERPSREDLFKPQVSTALGARYLRELHERFGARFIFTLAAYNAGPQRVPGWRPKFEVPGDVWVENVPYNETRTYIQRALSSLVMIGWRRNGEPTPVLPLLSPVPAAGEDDS
jgi:soluble lytic murein transglycosylase